MTDTIVWEDPPPSNVGAPRQTPAITAAQLRRRPGQWARIASKSSITAATAAAYHINHAHAPAFLPEGAFQATARTVWAKDAEGVNRPEHRVYARFTGGAR